MFAVWWIEPYDVSFSVVFWFVVLEGQYDQFSGFMLVPVSMDMGDRYSYCSCTCPTVNHS